ncbi:MAG TPA: prolipoprotein diacylglyceryl transferase family protein [Candidatus Bathyarchaeia archaeon]|nr:prolipoprotein diacylglyceryl transferase family protein [Candidatus Bathyarchaeia archaeon]
MYPILLTLGPINIYTFGVFLFAGFFLGSFIIWRRLRDQGWQEEKILDFLFLAALAGLLFSRTGFVITHFELFYPSLARVFLLGRYPGLSFWSGILGGFLAMGWFIRQNRWHFWKVIDEVIFGLAPFTVLFHLGAFFDGSKAGQETGAFWGVFFPESLVRRQPVALFETIGFWLIWLFLLRIERRWRTWSWYKSHVSGFIALAFFIPALFLSFLLAFIEEDKLYLVYSKQLLSLGLALGTIILLYFRSGRRFKEDLKIKKR